MHLVLRPSFSHGICAYAPRLLQDEYFPEELIQKYLEDGLDIDDFSASAGDSGGNNGGSSIFDGYSGGGPSGESAPTARAPTAASPATAAPSTHPSREQRNTDFVFVLLHSIPVSLLITRSRSIPFLYCRRRYHPLFDSAQFSKTKCYRSRFNGAANYTPFIVSYFSRYLVPCLDRRHSWMLERWPST